MTTDSIAAYDLASRVARYDRDMEIMHPNRAKMAEVILEVLASSDQGPPRVVDVGAGAGLLTKAILERFPQTTVAAVDGAQAMLDLARVRLGELAARATFHCGDFRELDSLLPGPQRWNAVVSSFALHHLGRGEKADVFGQIHNLLAPDGWFLNADIVIAEEAEIERTFQSLRVAGIVRRAAGDDERFVDVVSTWNYLDEMEARECDQPQTVAEDAKILREAGLCNVTVFWQEYREVVMGGRRG